MAQDFVTKINLIDEESFQESGGSLQLYGKTHLASFSANTASIITPPLSGNTSDNVLVWDSTDKRVKVVSQFSIADQSPAKGNDTEIQFNKTGSTAGDSAFTYDYTKDALTLGNRLGSTGTHSFAQGCDNEASGYYSTASGYKTKASGMFSQAHGYCTIANGLYSHAEGFATSATSSGSHSEGGFTKANGAYSHAEGCFTVASGIHSHAEGHKTKAMGSYTHAQGCYTTSCGSGSHTGGLGTVTRNIFACNTATFNHSFNDNLQELNHGALAPYSAILGGKNHNINVLNSGATIIGGDSIKLTGTTYVNTTVVDNLAINSTPITGSTNDDYVLVRESSTGIIKTRTAQELGGEHTHDDKYWKITGTTNVTDPIISGDTNHYGYITNIIEHTGGLSFKQQNTTCITGVGAHGVGVRRRIYINDAFEISQDALREDISLCGSGLFYTLGIGGINKTSIIHDGATTDGYGMRQYIQSNITNFSGTDGTILLQSISAASTRTSGNYTGTHIRENSLSQWQGTSSTELLKISHHSNIPTGTGGNYFLTARDGSDNLKASINLDGKVGVGTTGTGTTTHLYGIEDENTGLIWNTNDDISLYTGGIEAINVANQITTFGNLTFKPSIHSGYGNDALIEVDKDSGSGLGMGTLNQTLGIYAENQQVFQLACTNWSMNYGAGYTGGIQGTYNGCVYDQASLKDQTHLRYNLYVNQVNASSRYTGIVVNICESNVSTCDNRILDLQVDNNTVFRIDNSGNTTTHGDLILSGTTTGVTDSDQILTLNPTTSVVEYRYAETLGEDNNIYNVTGVTGNTTLTGSEYVVLVDSSGGTVTVTLPASPTTNSALKIKDKGNALTNNITVDGNGNDIDGSSTALINTDYGAFELLFDGTEWFSLAFIN
jgi:hypothetical protein